MIATFGQDLEHLEILEHSCLIVFHRVSSFAKAKKQSKR
jgi:hypothetical protein